MSAYARVAVARSGSGWSVSGNDASLVADADFPAVAVGAATATHFAVGRAASGAGQLLFFGVLTPPIVIAPGVTPIVQAGSEVSNAAPDALANAAATDLLELIFNNVAWANIGDATGLPGSAAAGSLYISLHTASPGEGGDQTTNECSYT